MNDIGQQIPTGADEVNALAAAFAPIGDWVQSAACGGADPEQFDAPAVSGLVSARQIEAFTATAAAFCAGCPVAKECLLDALDNDLTGLRGGVLVTGRPDTGLKFRTVLPARVVPHAA